MKFYENEESCYRRRFIGAYCAKKLEREFDMMLIDTKDYFEFTPGILKNLIEWNTMLRYN